MKKIAIIGPEASGKTELTNALAQELGGATISEFARKYLEPLSRKYTFQDVEKIAENQWRNIQEALNQDREWLFCDTELLVIHLWTIEVFDRTIPWVEKLLSDQPFDHFLLCTPDLQWEEDSLREAPEQATRDRYFDWFEAQLQAYKKSYGIVQGNENNRKDSALQFLKKPYKL